MFNLKNKTRIILGSLFILFVPLWTILISDELLKFPNDLNINIGVESFDNFYSLEKQAYQGEINSVTEFKYQAVDLKGDVLEVLNSFDVKTLSGEEIFSVERNYFVDIYSGEHQDYREGNLFAPRMKKLFDNSLDKKPFKYWHVNYDTPIDLSFRTEENISGIETYVYESNFSVDQTKELTGALEGVGEETGMILDVNIKVWIEPYTGRIVKYRDSAEAFYYSLETGERLHPWNKFRNNTSINSVTSLIKEISVEKQKIIFYEYIIPVLLILISLFLFSYSVLIKIFNNLFKKTNSKHKELIIPGIVFFICLMVTIFISSIINNISNQQINAEFEEDVYDVNDSIEDRLGLYANVLRGGRGLFDASNSVSRDEWKMYSNSLRLQSDYPGIQGIGYATVVLPEELDSFENSVREEGFSDFKVTPEYERDFYTSILYLEPFDARNRLAFGYDMFSEDNRRNAMEFARDSGKISISQKVKLLQEGETGSQAGFLMYEPVYDTNVEKYNLESRREFLLGYVYAAFRMNNLMVGIFSKDSTNIGVEIYDGKLENLDEDQIMYRNNFVSESPSFEKIEFIQLFNNYWTVRYTASDNYGFDIVRSNISIIFFVFGVLMSVAVSMVLYILNTRRARAEEYANEVTKDLQKEKTNVEKSASELEKSQVELKNKLKELEDLNKNMVNRELKMIELKEELKKYKNES